MSMNAFLVGEDDKYSQINQIVVGRDVLFEAIAFYLLTALVDSWSLWIAVAGDEDLGRRWRATSVRMVTSTGDYQPYRPTNLIVEAALKGNKGPLSTRLATAVCRCGADRVMIVPCGLAYE